MTRRLVGALVHEFRSPVAVIAGFAELLAALDPGSPRVREYALQISRSAGALEALLALGSEVASLQDEEAEVPQLGIELEEVLAAVAARRLSGALTWAAPRVPAPASGGGHRVLADPRRLARIVDILAGRAIEAGGGAPIRFRLAPARSKIRLELVDPTGAAFGAEARAGLEEDDLAVAIDRFGLASIAMELAIARTLARRMRGRLGFAGPKGLLTLELARAPVDSGSGRAETKISNDFLKQSDIAVKS